MEDMTKEVSAVAMATPTPMPTLMLMPMPMPMREEMIEVEIVECTCTSRVDGQGHARDADRHETRFGRCLAADRTDWTLGMGHISALVRLVLLDLLAIGCRDGEDTVA